jgi:hypothetical protein
MAVLNSIQLVGDIYVLTGSLIQVLGKMRIERIVRKRQKVPLPAGAKGIQTTFSANHIDILSFFLIGAGFMFFILTDFGIYASSPYLYLPSITLLATVAIMVFGTYFTVNVYDFEYWSFMWGADKSLFIGLGGMMLTLATSFIGFGIDSGDSAPLTTISFLAVLLLLYSRQALQRGFRGSPEELDHEKQ